MCTDLDVDVSSTEFAFTPKVTLIETYPHLVAYDTEVLTYFREQ